MNRISGHIICIIISSIFGFLRSGFTQYPWPVKPFNESQELTATFCEYRDTGSSDHFHNGVDIPKPDGSPVYPVENGTVSGIQASGTDAYVRVGRYCYLHIQPNPNLQIGDSVVKGQTVLGTILAGQGHLHFIDGYFNSEIDPIRKNGGLTPYYDPWPPVIPFIKFYVDRSEQQFTSNRVFGNVDIVVKVEEHNAPATAAVSRLNNGTYKLGYKILSSDRSEIVYSPPNGGLRFKFDVKPSNSYANNVYFKKLSSTSSHVYTVTNNVSMNGFWNTSFLNPGEYTVMVFTEDSQGNMDTLYSLVEVQEEDAVPPEVPIISHVKQISDGFQIRWYPNEDEDLLGYRLYYSYDNVTWKRRFDEKVLTTDSLTATFSTSLSRPIYFKLSAVDQAAVPNESDYSDVYGVKLDEGSPKPPVLIVDGFDRYEDASGWKLPSHAFAFMYGTAVSDNGFAFDCCSNDAVMDSTIKLTDYSAVFWFLGDESEKDETFSKTEQDLVSEYLSGFGRLFISGTDIIWDLDLDSECYATTEADELFLNTVLFSDFQGKIKLDTNITGTQGTIFQDMDIELDTKILPVDSVDSFFPLFPAKPCLTIDSMYVVGACRQYGDHPFGNSKLILFSIPLEIISSVETRYEIMDRILNYFFVMDGIGNEDFFNRNQMQLPQEYILEQNFPNPFHDITRFQVQIPEKSQVTIKIYNVMGQAVRTISCQSLSRGIFNFHWDARNDDGNYVPSGLYFYSLETDNTFISKKILLMRK